MYNLNKIAPKFQELELLIPYDKAVYVQTMTQKVDIEYTFFYWVKRINEKSFIVTDAYVPSQRCSGVTTEVTEEGEAEIMMHSAIPPKCWGHKTTIFSY